ncbi:hypothetical protein D3C80_391990 [compost metagenome]
MVPVADRRLCHLGNQRLGVAQHQKQQLAVAIDLGFQSIPLKSVCVAGALHDGPARGAFAAHEHRQANQTLIADYRDFRRGAVFHHVEQGNDRVGGEVDMSQGVPRLIQDLAEVQRYQFELRHQALLNLLWQCGEQVVLQG